MADRDFVLRIIGDISSVQKSMSTMEKDVGSFKSTATKIGLAVGGAFAADKVLDFGKAIVGAASDSEQALGGAQSVFKDYGTEIEKFSESTAKNMGLSKTSFLELATVSGALLKNAGVPLDQVTKSTEDLTTRASDLAAMFGGDVSQAMDAINAALKGEADPIEKYGISLKAAAVEQKAIAMGMVDAEGKATDYGKTMARVQLIMDQSADSAGTFKREQGSLAGQQATMSAQWSDMQATLGQKLLPTIVAVSAVLMKLMNFVIENQDWLVPMIAAIGAIIAAYKAWIVVQTLLNSAFFANPIGIIVVAIVGLIAAVVALYLKVDWFRDFVDKAIDDVVAAFMFLWDWIKRLAGWWWDIFSNTYLLPIRLLYSFIRDHADLIIGIMRTLVGWIRDAWSGVANILSAPFQAGINLALWYIDNLKRILGGMWNFVSGAFSGLADLLTAPFRFAFDQIKWLWNHTIGGFGFSLPSWIPGVGGEGFRIPYMAKGGIVTGPTLALLGEAGREAVIPLSGSNAVGMGNVTINVYALTANAEVGRRVWEAIKEYQRTSGGAPSFSSPALAFPT